MPGDNRILSISTPLGEDTVLLHKAKYRESLGNPFRIDLELVSDDENISLDDILGQNVTIEMETSDGSRFFNGIVTEFYQSDNQSMTARYGAVVRPWFWLLSLSENCRIFQEKSYPDIIKEVFDELGFSDFEDKLTSSYSPQDYVVQFNESDLNFVTRIMQQEGIFFYFKHIDGKHTLVMLDDNSSSVDEGEVAYFELEEESKHQGVDGITEWRNQRQVRSGGISLKAFDFELPSKDLSAVTSDPQTSSLSSFQKYRYPGKYTERADGEQYTKMLMQQENARYTKKYMKGNLRSLYAGAQFNLVDYPREDQNTQYLITDYECIMRGDSYMAEAQDSNKTFFEFSASMLPSKVPFRPELKASKSKMTGPQTATVVGKKGEEIWTDKYGRIKVQFHWDRVGKSDEQSSCWIRVSQTLAGKNWGSMYIPRIGQEVLVDFLNGDADKPIVIGCIYNGNTMPPYPLPENATITGYKSRSSKGGGGFNEIRFEDKKDEEQIYIHGQRNQDMLINNDYFKTIGNDQHVAIKNDKFEVVENDREEEVKNDHKEKIGNDRSLTVDGKESIKIEGTRSLTVSDDVSETFKGKYSQKVTDKTFMKAENICLQADSNITLKVGGSSIAIEKGGITIKTSGKMDIQAGAIMTLKGAMVKIN